MALINLMLFKLGKTYVIAITEGIHRNTPNARSVPLDVNICSNSNKFGIKSPRVVPMAQLIITNLYIIIQT